MSAAALTRGQQLVELGRGAEAETLAASCLAENPDSAPALQLLARALALQGRDDDAVRAITRSIAVNPESAFSFAILADIHRRRGDAAGAVSAATRATHLAPHLWWSHATLAHALMVGRRPRTRDALAAARQAVTLAPHEPGAHNAVGICLADLGDAETARQAYLEALRIDPHHAPSHNNLAALDVEGGRLGRAARGLRTTLATDPQLSVARANLDMVVVRFAWRVMVALLLVAALLLGELIAGAPWWVRAATGVIACAAFAVPTNRFLGHLPAGVTRWGRGLWGRVGWHARRVLALAAVDILGVTMMAFGPTEVGLVAGGVLFTLLRFVGMLMIGYFVIRAVTALFRGH